MKYIEISETIFRDLLSCKSKLEDIRVLLAGMDNRMTRRKLIERLSQIVNDDRYQDKEG